MPKSILNVAYLRATLFPLKNCFVFSNFIPQIKFSTRESVIHYPHPKDCLGRWLCLSGFKGIGNEFPPCEVFLVYVWPMRHFSGVFIEPWILKFHHILVSSVT